LIWTLVRGLGGVNASLDGVRCTAYKANMRRRDRRDLGSTQAILIAAAGSIWAREAHHLTYA